MLRIAGCDRLAGDARAGVVRGRRVAAGVRIHPAAIGLFDDLEVGIGHRLQFGRAVHIHCLHFIDSAVEVHQVRIHQIGVFARQRGVGLEDACRLPVGQRGRGCGFAAVGCVHHMVFDDLQAHQGLQPLQLRLIDRGFDTVDPLGACGRARQHIDGGLIADGIADSQGQNGVVGIAGAETGQAQIFEFIHAEFLRVAERSPCVQSRHGLDFVERGGEFVDLAHSVHRRVGQITHDGVQSLERIGIGFGGADVCPHSGIVDSAGVGHRGVDGAAIGLGQDRVVGRDQGFDFGGGVQAAEIVGAGADGIRVRGQIGRYGSAGVHSQAEQLGHRDVAHTGRGTVGTGDILSQLREGFDGERQSLNL